VDKICDFKYLHSNLSKNEIVPVFESTPIGISWSYDNKIYSRNNIENRLYADVDYEKNLIAVVDGPYANGSENSAIICDAINSVIFDIKQLFKEQCYINQILSPFIDVSNVFFTGVSYHKNDKIFYFFTTLNGVDFRFPFYLEKVEIGKLIESR